MTLTMAATFSKTRTCIMAKPLKHVSETIRERETFKYDPFLFTQSRFNSDGRMFPSSQLSTASESVLTALAQLGTYQTGTERAFISLFDSSHQYIVAEAVPSTPIAPGLSNGCCAVPLALCGTAIPRNQGTCDHVLYLTGKPGSEDEAELPLSFVPNMALDPRFNTRPYCQFGEGGQFYAGVPIRTQKGINIGVYCVMNPTVPKGWDEQCTRRLRDISHAIMEHLELNRSKHAYRRNELMIRGLGSFIEGKGTIMGQQSTSNLETKKQNTRLEGSLNVQQQQFELQKQEMEQKRREGDALESPVESAPTVEVIMLPSHGTSSVTLAEAQRSHTSTQEINSSNPIPKANAYRAVYPPPHTTGSELKADASKPEGHTSNRVFSKAANVIREIFEVEGCVFFNVPIASYRAPPPINDYFEAANVDHVPTQTSSTSSSDEQAPDPSSKPPAACCDLLAFSMTNGSSIDGVDSISGCDGIMQKRCLTKLLRRYPNGKIFNFDAEGELHSRDSSEDEDTVCSPLLDQDLLSSHEGVNGDASEATLRRQAGRRRIRVNDGAMIHQAFPSARSVAFVPVWDSKRERWFAGGFAYTLTPGRIFSEAELSFLAALSSVIATEALATERLRADQAKSDALGSLSHELRSPLHGVMLSTELLNDTDLSVFQGNATHTIETCCRTLLDTIDHLLEYAKVNSFAAQRKQRAKPHAGPPNLRKRGEPSMQFLKKNLYSNMRLDALIEEVIESVFAGFNFQHMSIRQLSKQSNQKHIDIEAHNRLDFAQAMEQLGPVPERYGRNRLQFEDVLVYLSISPTCNWMFHMQPGAIRRIVMNLFGNALKYTAKGTIRISVTQEIPVRRRSEMERLVKITVQDTGKGISEDYLRHKLFKPFSQEDELATGTGLGLSLVKKIVAQVKGNISVESQVGVGTTVSVTLLLEQSPQQSSNGLLKMLDDDNEFEEQLRELMGLRVGLTGFESQWSRNGKAIVEDICRRWLRMDIITDDDKKKPDIMLRSEDALLESFEKVAQLAETPNVVICQDALVAYQRSSMYDNFGQGGIFEFISQPIGPRKLAQSILLAYKRWMGLPKPAPPSRPGPSRATSSYSGRLSLKGIAIDQPPPSSFSKAIQPEVSEPHQTTNDLDTTISHPIALAPVQAPLNDKTNSPLAQEAAVTNKFLLVDDNHINLKILSAYMGKLGQAYEGASNGKEAVNAYTRGPERFAGILMDISMPVMDGLEATRHIRGHERSNQLHPVPIIALTGLASDSTHQEALESGVDVFLTKPVRLKVLTEVLESMGLLPAT